MRRGCWRRCGLSPGPRLFASAALATTRAERSAAMAGPRQGKSDKSDGKGARMLIVEARFYDEIADALLAGATRALEKAQATFERISVPGSLEIPTTIALAVDAARRRRRID